MGNCSSSTAPLDQSHPSLQDLVNSGVRNIGESANVGCGPAGSQQNYIGCPAGFTSANSNAGCYYCSGNPGTASQQSSGCSGGSCAIAGQRVQCTLATYLGNPSDCCTTGSSGAGQCDPQYANATASCDPYLVNFCTQGNNLSSNLQCTKWVQTVGYGDGQVQNAYNTWCAAGNNITSATCQNYCKSEQGKAYCDSQVESYCNANPTDTDFCACYNLPSTIKQLQTKLTAAGLSWTPACNYNACINDSNAYKPSNTPSPCPNQTVCVQGISLGSAETAEISNVSFSCKNDVNTNTNNTNTNNNTTSGGSGGGSGSGSSGGTAGTGGTGGETRGTISLFSTATSQGKINIALFVVGAIVFIIFVIVAEKRK